MLFSDTDVTYPFNEMSINQPQKHQTPSIDRNSKVIIQ